MNELTFKSQTIVPVIVNNLPYLTASQVGTALGYSRSDKINSIYQSHREEFTDTMTFTTDLVVQGQNRQVRVFSLRGCHLLAMFSKTPVAKEFRRWVLDLIEQHNKSIANYGESAINMKAIGGIVKKCCAVAVREELRNILAGDDNPEQWEISDQDLIYFLHRWHATKNKADTVAFRKLVAERDALLLENISLKDNAKQIKQLANSVKL